MPTSDIIFVFQWWSVLFLVGIAAFPLTKRLFNPPAGGWPATRSFSEGWYDRGYFFSKAVGMATVTYIIYVLGTLHIAPFTNITTIGAMGCVFIIGLFLLLRENAKNQSAPPAGGWRTNVKNSFIQNFSFARPRLAKLILIMVEEVCFFGALLLWSWVKGHEPSIRGLEKFMDFGFMQSILNSSYFPAPDMWFAGGNINYYYFGHLVTAVLTKLSGIDLAVTFNLMLVTIFAFTATMSFSIGYQLFRSTKHEARNPKQILNTNFQNSKRFGFTFCSLRSFVSNFDIRISDLIAGLLTAFLVTLAGNMQTLYVFTKGYTGDKVVPFWTILWPLKDFFEKVGEGASIYWYANATRFIPFSIHEFPSYSFVVSDVHGHVLSIPFVLLAIALLISMFGQINARDPLAKIVGRTNPTTSLGAGTAFLQGSLAQYGRIIFYGFILGILLMTNALDGPIYGLLFATLIATSFKFQVSSFKLWKPIIIVIIVAGLTALPFLIHFDSFASGIGVNCPPAFLANTKIGPFLFEGVEKCQKSPLWMMWILWGFFWYAGIWLFIKKIWDKEQLDSPIHRILSVFFLFSLALIIVPEFFYVKDIYPAHFRSNTMFKLGYQAFILWSITASYVITNFLFQRHSPQIFNFKFLIFNKSANWWIKFPFRRLFFILLVPQLFLVSIYPYFSVRSYFGELRTYQNLDGVEWLRTSYPEDWKAILWMKDQIDSPTSSRDAGLRGATITGLPVIVEADGESYTDYNHVSAFAGVPTIVGWGVHEWLWRGGYDTVSPRREDVKKIYEGTSVASVRAVLSKYEASYILVGKLEREKFKNLREDIIQALADPVFVNKDTVLYKVSGN